jgi:hypothetical protein
MIIIETFEPGCQPRLWPSHRSGSTAHHHHTPHHRFCPTPLSHWHWLPSPTATVGATFGWQYPEPPIPDQCADRIQGGQNQSPAAHSTLVPVCNRQIRSSTGAKSPQIDTTAVASSPAVSSPRGFFGRLPLCIPSHLCLAGIRKPLTESVIRCPSVGRRRCATFGQSGALAAH